jgi:hypothetical protein
VCFLVDFGAADCYEAGAKHIRIFGALRGAGLRPGLDGRMRPSFHELGGGEGEEEDGAVGQFAFGADGAAVGEHDVFGDGEAEAGASGFAGAGFVDAVEAFEEAREVFGGDAGSEVLNEEFDGVRDGAGAEDDASAGGSVFEGVFDEVGEDLMNGFAVGEDVGKIFRERVGAGKVRALQMVGGGILNLEIDAMGAGDFAEAFFGVMQEFGGGNALGIEAGFAGLDAGEGEQIFGEAGHPAGIFSNDFQEFAGGTAAVWIVRSGIEQGLGISLNRR